MYTAAGQLRKVIAADSIAWHVCMYGWAGLERKNGCSGDGRQCGMLFLRWVVVVVCMYERISKDRERAL